jgi:hypothetical protein
MTRTPAFSEALLRAKKAYNAQANREGRPLVSEHDLEDAVWAVYELLVSPSSPNPPAADRLSELERQAEREERKLADLEHQADESLERAGDLEKKSRELGEEGEKIRKNAAEPIGFPSPVPKGKGKRG